MRLIQQETRRFAKRQLTWFRKEPGIRWLLPDGDDWLRAAAETACGWIREAAADGGSLAAAGKNGCQHPCPQPIRFGPNA